jgi:hypothetical protein
MYTILYQHSESLQVALHTRRTIRSVSSREGDTGKIANNFASIANHDLPLAGPSLGWFIPGARKSYLRCV